MKTSDLISRSKGVSNLYLKIQCKSVEVEECISWCLWDRRDIGVQHVNMYMKSRIAAAAATAVTT